MKFGLASLLMSLVLAPPGVTAGSSSTCGSVGPGGPVAETYSVPGPPGSGRLIEVVSGLDDSNGDVSSVDGLLQNPGPDGISLREALEATNHQPGAYRIRFTSSLAGATIPVNTNLPILESGNVVLSGDVDGDGDADVMLEGAASEVPLPGIRIASRGNALHALHLGRFLVGVDVQPTGPDRVLSDNRIVGLTIENVENGILLRPHETPGANHSQLVADTGGTWRNTTIAANVIESRNNGIAVTQDNSAEGRVEGVRILGNRVTSGGVGVILIQAGFWAGSDRNTISDVEIRDNDIAGLPENGIAVTGGAVGASNNTIRDMRITGNRLTFSAQPGGAHGVAAAVGISLIAADGSTAWADPTFRPVGYPNDNRLLNVSIWNNTVEGAGSVGISVALGNHGAHGNVVDNVTIRGNKIAKVGIDGPPVRGMVLSGGSEASPVTGRPMNRNQMSKVTIEHNSVQLEQAGNHFASGGIAMVAERGGEYNSVQEVSIANNLVEAGGRIGIHVMGGWGDPGHQPIGNVFRRIEIRCNDVVSPPRLGSEPGVRGITIIGGYPYASGNRLERVLVEDNLVAGAGNDVAFLDNAQSASGNVVERVRPPADLRGPSEPAPHAEASTPPALVLLAVFAGVWLRRRN